jgi:hypothetical protein
MTGASPSVAIPGPNAGVTFTTNKDAGDAGTDIVFNTTNTRSAGLIFDVKNNGVSVLSVDYNGGLSWSGASLTASASNGGVTLTGNKDAGDAGADILCNTTNTRTAGALLDVQNDSTSKFKVGYDGALTMVSGTTTASNAAMTLTGNRDAGDSGADIILDSTNTRTAGDLVDIQNNGTSKFKVDYTGLVTFLGGKTTTANTGLTFTGNKTAGDSGTDVIVNSTATRTAGDMFRVQNNGTPYFAVDFSGYCYSPTANYLQGKYGFQCMNATSGIRILGGGQLTAASGEFKIQANGGREWIAQTETVIGGTSNRFVFHAKAGTMTAGRLAAFGDQATFFMKFGISKEGYPEWIAANEQTTVGSAGGASALPATPTKYLKIMDSAGTTLVIPAYAQS